MEITFEQALHNHNFTFPDKPITHHHFTRWGKDNEYWAIAIGNGYCFGNWKTGQYFVWFPEPNKPLSYIEIKKQKHQIAEAKKLASRLLEEEHNKTAIKAQHIINHGSNKGYSPYLELKRVKSLGLAFHADFIAIPLRDIEGKIWNIQRIYPNKSKRFLKGGKKKGCFHIIGSQEHLQHVYVCEGYATGASIHMATGATVIVCFDAYNLLPVIKHIKTHLPRLDITIAADNDAFKEHNTGKEEAYKVAETYNCRVVLPEFSASNQPLKPTDFNDLHILEGLHHVRTQLQ